MKVSVVVINNNQEKLQQTLDSIEYQTFNDYEKCIVEPKEYADDPLKDSVNLSNGEYCLVLNAGDTLKHDTVLQEVFAYKPTEDFIFGNIIYHNNSSQNEQRIIQPESFRAKNFIIEYIPFQGVFFKREALKDTKLTDSIITSFYLFLLNSLLVEKLSYRKVNVFVSTCNLNFPDIKHLLFSNDKLPDIVSSLIPNLAEDYNDLILFNSDKFEFLKKLADSHLIKFIQALRNILNVLGYYNIKSGLVKRKYFRKSKKSDVKRRKELALKINFLAEINFNKNGIIVSLTSHGNRVESSAPYAIYSIFTQTLLPEKVILNLNKEKWNNNNLPKSIKQLQRAGLEVKFCDDIGPHTKLIPTLRDYPNNVIITVDDDIYYHERTIEELHLVYQKSDKHEVICRKGAIVEKRKGKYIPYTQWKSSEEGNKYSKYIAYGFGGVLYPPNIFNENIFNADLLFKLCPNEDDMWYWAIENKGNIAVRIVDKSTQHLDEYVNRVEQFVSKNSKALHHINHGEGKSDSQLKKLIQYFEFE